MTQPLTRCLLIPCAIVTLSMALACVAGCRAPEETFTMRDRPVGVDPAYRVDVIGWWSNGQELLHIDRDGGYQLYADSALLDSPLQRGRWEHRTPSRLSLEPYTEIDTEPLNVQVMAVDNEYVLRMPGYADFRAAPARQVPDRRDREENLELRPSPIQSMSNRA